MNNTEKATEMQLPEGVEPFAMMGSGPLRAFVWRKDGECHLAILRKHPATGEYHGELQPSDLEHLARVVAVIATSLHCRGNLEDELSNNLGCLGHCIGQVLGMEFDESGVPFQTVAQ